MQKIVSLEAYLTHHMKVREEYACSGLVYVVNAFLCSIIHHLFTLYYKVLIFSCSRILNTKTNDMFSQIKNKNVLC